MRRKHGIILVHGIQTFGAWQDRFGALLKKHKKEVEVHIYKYGYRSVLELLIPFLRLFVIRRFQQYLLRRSCTSILRIIPQSENQGVSHRLPRREGKRHGRRPPFL
jgi:hypothetical protein